ncbi:MAG: hypothetical protein OEV50_07180, partial [Candidatus Aminicenantes bacterium]|nr:hypothetical protein [Candidatus Aminicenantes bacterium]
MKRIIILLSISMIISISLYSSEKEEELNLLSGKYTPERLKEIIIPAEQWHPFPRASEQAGWQKLREKVRAAHLRQGEKHLGCDW